MKKWAFVCPPAAAGMIAAGFLWSKQASAPTSPPLNVTLFQFVNSVANIMAFLLLGLGLLLILKDKTIGAGNKKGFYVVWYFLFISFLAFIGGIIMVNLS